MRSINAVFPKFKHRLLNNKTNYLIKFNGVCPRTLEDMAILTFQMGEVCVLPDRFIPSSQETYISTLYIILPSFFKNVPPPFEMSKSPYLPKFSGKQNHRLTRVKQYLSPKQSLGRGNYNNQHNIL